MVTLPKINLKGIKQEDFDGAAKVLASCLHNYSALGHETPFFSPGGHYGECWWSLDEALALSGYKWLDRGIAEKIFLNLAATQKPNGRILLWGHDHVYHIRNPKEEISSLPKFFETGILLCRQSENSEFIRKVYDMFTRNLEWWVNERQDPETKLITALFEETFIPYLDDVREYAPVDTNILIACAYGYTSELSFLIGRGEKASYFDEKKKEILAAVNTYLWDDDDSAYYPYLIKERKRKKLLMASTFSGFVAAKGDGDKTARLLKLLKDDGAFHFDTCPLTSVSKKDQEFTLTNGDYKGNPSWSGMVWTLLNEAAVRGLLAAGERETAAELAYKTVLAFNGNYAEFLNTFDGSGHGVLDYGWSAAQYVSLIIDYIFGVQYAPGIGKMTVEPLIPKALKGEIISIKGLPLPNGKIADIEICGKTENAIVKTY